MYPPFGCQISVSRSVFGGEGSQISDTWRIQVYKVCIYIYYTYTQMGGVKLFQISGIQTNGIIFLGGDHLQVRLGSSTLAKQTPWGKLPVPHPSFWDTPKCSKKGGVKVFQITIFFSLKFRCSNEHIFCWCLLYKICMAPRQPTKNYTWFLKVRHSTMAGGFSGHPMVQSFEGFHHAQPSHMGCPGGLLWIVCYKYSSHARRALTSCLWGVITPLFSGL